MTFKQLQKNSYSHQYAINIDKFFPKWARNLLRRTSLFAASLSFAFSFDSSPLYFGVADGIFFLFVVVCLIMFFIEFFYRSMMNEGIVTRAEERAASLRLDFSLSTIIFATDEIDTTRALFETKIGKEIFDGLGLSFKDRDDFVYGSRTPIIASSLDFSSESVDLLEYARVLYDADKSLQSFLSGKNIERSAFLDRVSSVMKAEDKKRRQGRFWSRENLGVIPSIGSSWIFGKTEKNFASSFIAPVSVSDNDVEQDDGAAALDAEEALNKSEEANAILVYEKESAAEETIKDFAQRIKLGVAPPPLKHKSLLRLDWKRLFDESEKGSAAKELSRIFSGLSGKDIVLYIPDFPWLLSASKPLGFDFLSFVLPYLSSNELQILASSSAADYKYFIETQAQLNQKFQKIEIA